MPLSTKNFFDMFKYGMELKGYTVKFVNQKSSKDKGIYFDVGYDVVSFGSKRKKYGR